MATKTITITKDAYDRLLEHKIGKDSFSDVVVKLSKRHGLFDLIGSLSEQSVKEIRKKN